MALWTQRHTSRPPARRFPEVAAHRSLTGWEDGLYKRIRQTLLTERGRTLYAKRKITVEPVYGQIKHNRRIDRFMRRGRSAAQSEWRLVTATHNLLKLHSHWIANTT